MTLTVSKQDAKPITHTRESGGFTRWRYPSVCVCLFVCHIKRVGLHKNAV